MAEQSFLFDVKERDKKLLRKLSKTGKKNNINNKLSLIIKNAESEFNQEDYDKYDLIENKDQLKNYCDKIIENGIFSLDTESNVLGKSPDPIDDEIVGISLYTPAMKPCYIPLNHTEGNLDFKDVEEQLIRIKDCKAIYHNAKYDIKVILNNFNVYLGLHWDTYLAACYLNEEEPHGLKYLYDKYISKEQNKSSKTFSDLFKGVDFSYIPLYLAKCYAAKDAIITYQLYEFQEPYLNPDNSECEAKDLVDAAIFLRDVEYPLTFTVIDMEQEGIHIDEDYSEKLIREYKNKEERIKVDLYEYIDELDFSKISYKKKSKLGVPVNLNSPAQLAIILYDVCGFDNGNHKENSTSEKVLKYLANNLTEEKDIVFIKNLLRYREINKLLNTYIIRLPELVKEQTGKLHTNFNQHGAKTGRFSSNNPNLQSIPSKNKEIRKLFIAPEDYYMISADYSQQEPRVLTHLCGDSNLIETYQEGKDLYAMMSAILYNDTYENSKEHYPDGSYNKLGKQRRDKIKSMILGLMYGMGTGAMAEIMNMEKEEAKEFIDLFFNKFPSIQEFISLKQSEAYQNGYVKTVYGRKRRLLNLSIPEFEYTYYNSPKPVPEQIQKYYSIRMKGKWSDEKDRIKEEASREYGIKVFDNGIKIADAERQVVNSIIQGTSADITKIAMLNIHKDKELNDLGFKLLLTVHDEVIGISPKENIQECINIIENIMLNASNRISVPMSVDFEITKRWYGEEVEV